MHPKKLPKSLNRPSILLIAITLVVVATISVNFTSWRSTESVSKQTGQLINESIPQLKVISQLESIVNERILQLYTYYSTLEMKHWEKFLSLQDNFQNQCEALIQGNSIFDYHKALRQSNEQLNNSAFQFHEEMLKGSSRNWDALRGHLVAAQQDTDELIYALEIASSVSREAAVRSSQATLLEVLSLKNIQLWFSASVVAVAFFLIFMLRGRMKDQRELYKRAYFDSLTGLPNRKHFEEDWKDKNTTNKPSNILLIKLDHYHLIASTFGHNFADEAALQVCERLSSIQHKSHDTSLYQFSSATWLFSINHKAQNISDISFAEKINSIIANKSLVLDDSEISVTCSIGIANYPTHAKSMESLLRNADSALYVSQKSGRNTYTVFHPDIKNKIDKQLAMECNLRDALHKDEFELYFQPKVDTTSHLVSSAEALIRWHHKGKIVSPAEFIPVAERSNLILDIGNWVIDEACQNISTWRRNGMGSRKIAVNISPKHFLTDNFVTTVESALERHELPPECLELEITEEATMEDPITMISRLHELKSIGVTISIDDFGTGYSSLSYLRDLPIDAIKIDKSFITAMTSSHSDLVVVQMIIDLAKNLNLKVIAEGVETKEQQEILTQYQCNYLQGYLFSKPLSAENYAQYLHLTEANQSYLKTGTSLH